MVKAAGGKCKKGCAEGSNNKFFGAEWLILSVGTSSLLSRPHLLSFNPDIRVFDRNPYRYRLDAAACGLAREHGVLCRSAAGGRAGGVVDHPAWG
jgi:hypothetical protein